jgi:uncharacterized lipoprotein YmbA
MKPYAGTCLPLLLGVTACSAGPPPRTYLLTPPLEAASLVMPAAPAGHIVIRRVLVPDYLDTTDILLRDGSSETKISATGRWGERLSQGLTHALAADLTARLPTGTIELDPGTERRQLLIDVTALDLWPDGRCAMAATWTLIDHDAPRAVAGGSGTFESTPVGGTTDVGDERLVEAVTRAVDQLADAISKNIQLSTERSAQNAD